MYCSNILVLAQLRLKLEGLNERLNFTLLIASEFPGSA